VLQVLQKNIVVLVWPRAAHAIGCRSWSKSAHKCILYNNRCAKCYPDQLRFGSTRAKNLFWSKNRERPSLCLSVKSSIRRNITIAVRVTENVFFDAVFREVVIIVAV